ncbi:WLM domain-domain-containing protein [Clohesyomyces aquaticus]|uniref:WLM domain-domain-containing protein n=1 Tax=Clohesyomyces aquaticus TaxID=1231657 RepID=A0A1Y1Z454_9PLEO|nr:WLM domain-domain-containing protein [Clohesyomyces aquaticus]
MPLGFERLNERTSRPNGLINFIKPLPGSSSATALTLLNRVAAICYPFMKAHSIVVQSLEEFPVNNEFVGRNFNAGEVIQLVLRNRKGDWLPEKWVMMVMVHELAHCKQMNHSKAFWAVRNVYARDLTQLWAKGYTGEGLWGRGRSLETGEVEAGSVGAGDVPEHLCGGTYGRRRKRRRNAGKEKETLSYTERKQRRILKKFGAGGQALGADDDAKVRLEGGVPKKGKPRVAKSQRGRDLRAAAALARFGAAKKEEVDVKKEDTDSESETEDEYEEVGESDAAIDVDGKKMHDDKGHALVKICEEEDDKDGDALKEMEEMLGIQQQTNTKRRVDLPPPSRQKQTLTSNRKGTSSTLPHLSATKAVPKSTGSSSAQVIRLDEIHKRRPEPPGSTIATERRIMQPKSEVNCPICSLANEPGSLVCMVCSHVLDLHLAPNHWKCGSATCNGSKYVNSGDAGVCGVCGTSKSA